MLGSWAESRAAELGLASLKDPDKKVVLSGLYSVSLRDEEDDRVVAEVGACLCSEDGDVRATAVGVVLHLGQLHRDQVSRVVAMLQDEHDRAREAAVAFFEATGAPDMTPEDVDEVAKGLVHSDGRFQAAAALALGFLGASAHAASVAKLLERGFEDTVAAARAAAGAAPHMSVALRRPACAAAFALALMGEEGAAFSRQIADKIGNDDLPGEVVASFVHALGLMGPRAAKHQRRVRMLLESGTAVESPVRVAACFALGEFAQAEEYIETAEVLAGALEDPNSLVREAAAKALGKMKEEGAGFTEELCTLFQDRVANVQIAALEAVGSLGEHGEVYAAEVCALLYSDDNDVRLAAIEVLGNMGDRGAAFAADVAELLQDPEAMLREEALLALAKMGDEATPFVLDVEQLYFDADDAVCEAARVCVESLTR